MAAVESALLAALAASLANLRGKVQYREPSSSSRPDIVVTIPDGKTYVLEVKLGEGRAHFASIAQVESLANELRERQGEDVVPILVTNLDVPPTLSAVADRVGVEVVEAKGSTDEMTESVVNHLESGS